MPPHPLRAALLGTGDVARLHASALHGLDGVDLVAAASPSLADSFCRDHGIPHAYDSLEAMLLAERPDVVHLCTPPDGQAVQAARAFDSGAHVVTEKPAAQRTGCRRATAP
jgi:predicted dehydrogenase